MTAGKPLNVGAQLQLGNGFLFDLRKVAIGCRMLWRRL
jgi:hypothetical protein